MKPFSLGDQIGNDRCDLQILIEMLSGIGIEKEFSSEQLSALSAIARHVTVAESGCWEWSGCRAKFGYGKLTFRRKSKSAHKFCFETIFGEITDGLWVLHRCDNPPCINPRHLYKGTPSNNRSDALERDRWVHKWHDRETCSRGHRYDEPPGFYVSKKDGARVCRMCQRIGSQKHRANKSLSIAK